MAPTQSKTLKTVFSYQSWVHAVSGAAGSVVAMSAFYPLDTVRHHMQIEDASSKGGEKKRQKTTYEVIQEMISEDGVASLYRGLIPVLQSLCISNFVYFYTFHSLKALNSSKQQYALRDLVLGSLAGIVNVLTTTPFWVVNTRLKVKGAHDPGFTNLFSGLRHIAQTEGVKNLWAGAMAGIILVLNPAIQFMTYEAVKRRFLKHNPSIPTTVSFAIGALAKAVATVLTYPLQLVQTRKRHGKGPTMGTIRMLLHIINTQGFGALFRGLEAKLLQTTLTAALMFATYEKIAKFVMSLLLRQNTPRVK